ncbi:MAG: N-6 DNA methylase [Candidatus Bathyarchaeota archaeon]|nr:N-6 DNA methylase [Candidatus Bathyarchaeota archaeon]
MSTLEMTEPEIKNMIVNMLIEEYNYPSSNIYTEVSASLGNARFKADVVVYSNNHPHILVEIKNIKNTLQFNIHQLERITEAINPHFTILTNGLDFKFYKVITDNYKISLKEITDIPKFNETLTKADKEEPENLVTLSDNRYLTMMWRHFDILRGESHHPFDSFKYLLLLYAAKYYDEKSDLPIFYLESNPEITRNKILGLVNNLVDANDGLSDVRIPFKAESLYEIVRDLQKASLTTSTESFKKILPTLINRFGKNLQEYTTPEIIANLIVDTLNPGVDDLFLDPACGLAGFLLKMADTGSQITGLELSLETAHLANLIIILSGVSGTVHHSNGLDVSDLNENKYSIVAVQPPFGLQINEPRPEYSLYKYPSKTYSEELFVEAVLKYLKPNGLGAILVPNGFLSLSNYSSVRQFLLQNSKIKGVFNFSPDLYDNWFRISTSLLIFEKSMEGTSKSDPVFFCKLDNKNYEKIVQDFKKYLDLEYVEDHDSVVITPIISPDNLDFDYIQGFQYLQRIDGSHFIELGRLIEVITGASLNRVGEVVENGSYSYIRASNIGEGVIDFSHVDSITLSDPHSKYLAQPNDVLLSRAGTIGKVAIVANESNLVIGSNVVILRIKDNRIKSEFLLGFLLSNLGKRQLVMYSTGSTISHISSKNIGRIKIPVHDLNDQNNVVGLLQNLVSLKNKEEELIQKIKQKRVLILEQLDSAFKEGV